MAVLNNYVVYHLHSDDSLLDSATKFKKYLDKAVDYGMTAIGFSEHGNVFNWINKKMEAEARGLKYIHAMEAYVTEDLNTKVRDNYHMMFIAKNLDGVRELNKMSSKAYYKNDGHYYYDARFSLDEVMATSDNIMITTSCLGGILAKGRRLGSPVVDKFLDWAIMNKHRVFLEIQYHNHREQIEHNSYLVELSVNHGFQLIVGTDTHSLDAKHAKGRKILMQAKNIQFQEEDKFDLTFKSYREVLQMFKIQNSINDSDDDLEVQAKKKYDLLTEETILEALNFTNTMADMVESFELDKSAKYPKLHDNSEEVFRQKINAGIVRRGVNKFEKDKRKLYYDTIHEEFEVYKKLDAIDYMLFQEDVIEYGKSQGIYPGYGRGSVNGSLIAYVLGITEMDSIKHKLNFFRFLNPERISLADIDIDWPPSRRQEIIDYVASKEGIYFSEIVTFNTIADKGAIREVGRALKYDLEVVDDIAKNYEEKPNHYRSKYPEMFEYVDLIKGVNVSVGSHPSGYLISPIPLDESVGTFFTNESKYPVSQVNMKELDKTNYVKLDILGLDNIEIINTTCESAGIERITPDNVDINDEDVWGSMRESTLGIFQWESDSAFAYYKRLFSPETLKKIKEQNPSISYIDLFSIGNGAIRPSGDSYRDDLANGVFKDNGHISLNEFLKDTIGYLVYQEQIMNWLVDFCGYSGKQSDTVRRSIAKKDSDDFDTMLSEIRNRFIGTMATKYDTDSETAEGILESLLQVIDDAQRYGFSVNHSSPYSYTGYICGYLRHYYPLAFLTSMLNLNDDDVKKTGKIIEYANKKGIEIRSIKFRKSVAAYSYSVEENSIFKGLKSIKFLNEKIAIELYELGQRSYQHFVDLLVDIVNETTVDARQLNILIRLNFFEEFGEIGKLLSIYSEFSAGKNRYSKSHKEDTKMKRLPLLYEYEVNAPLVELEMIDILMFEKEHLGYIDSKIRDASPRVAIILDIDTKYTPKVFLYQLRSGQEAMVKVRKKNFYDYNDQERLHVGDIIKVGEVVYENKKRKINGEWVELEEREPFMENCFVLKNNDIN